MFERSGCERRITKESRGMPNSPTRRNPPRFLAREQVSNCGLNFNYATVRSQNTTCSMLDAWAGVECPDIGLLARDLRLCNLSDTGYRTMSSYKVL